MKKAYLRTLTLVLALAMLLSSGAFAMTQTAVDAESTTDHKLNETQKKSYDSIKLAADKAEVVIDGTNPEKLTFTYTNPGVIVENGFYLVTMITKEGEKYEPNVDTIEYINQHTGQAEGKLVFDIYPDQIQDSVILIYGASSTDEPLELLAAVIDAAYMLGDVDGDGEVTAWDGMYILRAQIGLESALEGSQIMAGDTDHDGSITAWDGMKILRAQIGLESLT